MSLGESHTAFFNAIADIKIALFAGERLNTLLERVDYYLELAGTCCIIDHDLLMG